MEILVLTSLFVDSNSGPRGDYIFLLPPRPASRGESRRVWTGVIDKVKERLNREDTSTHGLTHRRTRATDNE